MKSLKPVVRECMAYIAVHHPNNEFSRHDIPEQYRVGLSGLTFRGHITRIRREENGDRVYKTNPDGIFYATRFMSVEMEQMRV